MSYKIYLPHQQSHGADHVYDAQTNCLTEMFFAKALERARFLDDYLRQRRQNSRAASWTAD